MEPTSKTGRWLKSVPYVLTLLSIITAIIVYQYLPDKVPSHWNINNEIDGYANRFWGAFMLPTILIVLNGLLLLIPKIEPRKLNIKESMGTYYKLIAGLNIFFTYVYALTLIAAFNPAIPVGNYILPPLGLLFVGIGVMLPKMKPNWFMGIRTPWTLSSNTVWEKTHVLGGKLFIASGVISMLSILWPKLGVYFLMIPVLIATFVSVVYSYLEYRKSIR